MKLALVFDAPHSGGPFGGVSGTYLQRLLDACAAEVGLKDLEVAPFFAVSEMQPGGKAPPIKLIREQRERLREGLYDWNPDAILSFGTSALNALDGGEKKVLAISKERGRMRWLRLDEGFKTKCTVRWVPTISHAAVIRAPDLHRDIANDVFKVMTQIEPLPPMNIDLWVPDTTAELSKVLAWLDSASVVGVDVETTGLSPYNDDLLAVGIGASYSDGSGGIAVVVKQSLIEQSADILWDAVWRKSRRSVGQNYKFDQQFLAPLIGWAPDGALLGDTLLLGHLARRAAEPTQLASPRSGPEGSGGDSLRPSIRIRFR